MGRNVKQRLCSVNRSVRKYKKRLDSKVDNQTVLAFTDKVVPYYISSEIFFPIYILTDVI